MFIKNDKEICSGEKFLEAKDCLDPQLCMLRLNLSHHSKNFNNSKTKTPDSSHLLRLTRTDIPRCLLKMIRKSAPERSF